MAPLQILDGPMGTELLERGVPTPLPGWSAHALETAPATVVAIHRDYAEAGANVHTTNTFRTQPRVFPDTWEHWTRVAADLARTAIAGTDGRLAGSISPIEDCYVPAMSPPDALEQHRLMARALAAAGVDLLLVETFPHIGEALAAATAALETGNPTWVSFTAGPSGDLLTPDEVRDGARRAVALGVEAVLVNCIPTPQVAEFLPALAGHGVAFGAYGNAGEVDEKMGFRVHAIAPAEYRDYVASWRSAGATIVGGCCGTGVEHIRAIAR